MYNALGCLRVLMLKQVKHVHLDMMVATEAMTHIVLFVEN